MKKTDISNPEHFHQVVDCQWACPAHTPVPEYIRLIAEQRYTDAYMINWHSNVFPGVLGRTCDRPCEPACRRGRVEESPVAICRLKRVAADHKGDVEHLLPEIPAKKNGFRVGIVGAGPASLTVARDLAPLGYEIDVFDNGRKGGGMMRTQIPAFRLPDAVLDDEVSMASRGVNTFYNQEITSLSEFLTRGYDAIFVGTGAPRGRDLELPGRKEGNKNIHVGIQWLANVTFEHVESMGRRVVVLGGGNTAMDCCRSARRMGVDEVSVYVRSGFDEMKASPWEIEDAQHEDIPIFNNHVPQEFVVENGKLVGIRFEKIDRVADESGRLSSVPTGEPPVLVECDEVIIAVGQENAFTWIETNIGLNFDRWGMPIVDKGTLQSTMDKVFFGGDAAFGAKNVITAVAHGHQAAISIDLFCNKEPLGKRPDPRVSILNQKMGMHEWSYTNDISLEHRHVVPLADKAVALKDIKLEVELGFEDQQAFDEASRCLNCDVQTVFTDDLCIECDACVDICPTSCITFTKNRDEDELRAKLKIPAINEKQPLYVSDALGTGRVMVKDEDVCLHCGMCAERCPSGAWDMRKYLIEQTHAGNS